MKTYSFRRTALNASYSDRTAKIGKPLTGSIIDAVKEAMRLSNKHTATVFVYDEDTRVLSVSAWGRVEIWPCVAGVFSPLDLIA